MITSDTGETIEKITGRIRGFFLENEWVLFSPKRVYIDHDWNLAALIKRHKNIKFNL